jgi:hypothetical protein
VPFDDPGRLVTLTIDAEPVTPGSGFGIHDADASRWRSENRTFSRLEGALLHGVQMETAAGPQPIRAIAAESGLFDLLGMGPLLGRGLVDDDFRSGPAQWSCWVTASGFANTAATLPLSARR